MTNISNAEKIRNAVVNLFTGKVNNNDKAEAEKKADSYLDDYGIDENEYAEISAEFGEDFVAELRTIAGEAPKDIENVEAGNALDYSKAIGLASGVKSALEQPDNKEDWNKVIELLQNATPEEIQAANLYFQIEYGKEYEGRDMIQEIAANYPDGGSDESIKGQRDAFKLAMQGATDVTNSDSLERAQRAIATFSEGKELEAKDEDTSELLSDMEAIEVAAQVENAINGKKGKEDWDKAIEILEGLSDKQMQQVNIAYKLTYGDAHEGRDMIQEICANEIDDNKTSNQELKNKAMLEAMRGQTDLTSAESIGFEQSMRNSSTSEAEIDDTDWGVNSEDYPYAGFVYDPNSPYTLSKQKYLYWAANGGKKKETTSVAYKSDVDSTSGTGGTGGTNGATETKNNSLSDDECKKAIDGAKEIHDALNQGTKGENEDWDRVNKVLKDAGNDGLKYIAWAYEALYGKDLYNEINTSENDHGCGFLYLAVWNHGKHNDWEAGQEAAIGYFSKCDWNDDKDKIIKELKEYDKNN